MKLFKKRILKPNYIVECGNCGWQRATRKSPSDGYYCSENSASRCPICNNNGGSVCPYGYIEIDNSLETLKQRQKNWIKVGNKWDKECDLRKVWNKISMMDARKINWNKESLK